MQLRKVVQIFLHVHLLQELIYRSQFEKQKILTVQKVLKNFCGWTELSLQEVKQNFLTPIMVIDTKSIFQVSGTAFR